MAAHRYWRFLFDAAQNGGNYATVGEVELRIAAGGADQTGSGTAAADSAYPGYPASYAFANNGSAYTQSWVSASGFPHWLSYDFGAGNEKDIVEYVMTAASSPHETPVIWDFQYSDDGTTWTTIVSKSGITWSADEAKIFSATPVVILSKGLNVLSRRDINNGGGYRIYGTAKRLGAVTQRQVILLDRKTRKVIRETVSDPDDGSYSFDFIAYRYRGYIVMELDWPPDRSDPLNAAVADLQTPVPMP